MALHMRTKPMGLGSGRVGDGKPQMIPCAGQQKENRNQRRLNLLEVYVSNARNSLHVLGECGWVFVLLCSMVRQLLSAYTVYLAFG